MRDIKCWYSSAYLFMHLREGHKVVLSSQTMTDQYNGKPANGKHRVLGAGYNEFFRVQPTSVSCDAVSANFNGRTLGLPSRVCYCFCNFAFGSRRSASAGCRSTCRLCNRHIYCLSGYCRVNVVPFACPLFSTNSFLGWHSFKWTSLTET